MMIYQSTITIATKEPLPDSARQMQRKNHTGFCVNSDIFLAQMCLKGNLLSNTTAD